MKRLFNRPEPKTLLGQPKPGGCYRLDKSTELILEARRRKRRTGSDPDSLGQTLLEAIALAVCLALAAFVLLWIICAGNEPKASSEAFCGALWAFGGLMVVCGIILTRNAFRK